MVFADFVFMAWDKTLVLHLLLIYSGPITHLEERILTENGFIYSLSRDGLH